MKKINLGNAITKVHFIGIGGISMSGLAEVLKRDGYTVTGSDNSQTAITDHLQSVGIPVAFPNAAANIPPDADMIVYTAAIRPDNPEFIAARETGKPMLERAALLGLMLQGYDKAICVAGSHGKTTATMFMTEILLEAGLDPTISIGGHLGRTGSNYRVGESDYFLLESCEYSNSFLHWHPHVGIILNIDADHLDFFGTFENVVASFKKFAENIRPGGVLVVQEEAVSVIASKTKQSRGTELGLLQAFGPRNDVNIITFGETSGRFIPGSIVYDNMGRPSFDVLDNNIPLARINLPIPGSYNMLNALAAFAAAYGLGVAPDTIARALSNAKGVKRRYEYKGTCNGIQIIDDYAHHPTAILECLAASRRAAQGRLVCIFQPHTYTRTRNHFDDFARAFTDADKILLLPIYAAREPFDPSISSLQLADAIRENGKDVLHLNDFDEAINFLQAELIPGDLLITMGAGDVHFVGEALLETRLSTVST